MIKNNTGSDVLECEKTILLSEQLKALAHPARLQILIALSEQNNCCCNDFCACLPLAQSTISQHLKILKNAGIIQCDADGNCSRYSLNPKVLKTIIGNFNKLGDLLNSESQITDANFSASEIQKVH